MYAKFMARVNGRKRAMIWPQVSVLLVRIPITMHIMAPMRSRVTMTDTPNTCKEASLGLATKLKQCERRCHGDPIKLRNINTPRSIQQSNIQILHPKTGTHLSNDRPPLVEYQFVLLRPLVVT